MGVSDVRFEELDEAAVFVEGVGTRDTPSSGRRQVTDRLETSHFRVFSYCVSNRSRLDTKNVIRKVLTILRVKSQGKNDGLRSGAEWAKSSMEILYYVLT